MSWIKNLFGSEKDFFDKEATIKEYFALVPQNERPKAKNYDELYSIALNYVEKQDFKANTSDQDAFFHELSKDEILIAICAGTLAYAIVREIDQNGSTLEKAIDSILPKDYDKNNPFDTKQGYGHRMFGHDPVTFGIKNIPGDTLIKVKDVASGNSCLVKIGEYLGVGTERSVSMWDLIWKFYGDGNPLLKGIVNCLKHTIVHFGKDLLTPVGIPLPFTSLLDSFEYNENMHVHTIKYRDSWAQKLDRAHLKLKASDFASLVFIETVISIYCSTKKYGTKQSGFIQDMKLIAMGTCISIQMATAVIHDELQIGKRGNKPVLPGGNTNLLLIGTYVNVVFQEIKSTVNARKDINASYRGN